MDNEMKVNGLTVDEALVKYEPMVHRIVSGASTSVVCTYDDLAQEGRMAIVVAFQNYDPSKGASLTTWMYCMIKDAIAEYQKQNLSILSGGSYLQNVLRKAGQDATTEEIMEFGVSKKTAMAATQLKNSFAAADYDSLETYLGAEDMDHTSLDALDWRSCLTPTEQYVVGNYYGFNGQRQTMTEIGKALGKSRKSISYMLNKAIVKIRHIPGIEEYAT